MTFVGEGALKRNVILTPNVCVNTLKTILKREPACKFDFPCLGGRKRGQNAYVGPIIFHAVVISPSIQKYSQAKIQGRLVAHEVCIFPKAHGARTVLNTVL